VAVKKLALFQSHQNCKQQVPKEQRKLASYEVAGFLPDKIIHPERTMEKE
jgi:hypothetical protein